MHEAERSELESPVQIPHFQEPPFRDADACGGQADDAEHPRPVQHAQRPVPDVEIAEIGLGHGEAAHVPHGVHGHDAQQAPRRAGPVDGHGHGFKAGGGMLFKGLVHAFLSRELTSHSFSSAFRLPRATMKGEASALSAAFRTAVLYGLSREGASQEFSCWA